MATEFKAKINPFTGQLQLVPTNVVLSFKAAVATSTALPLTGNAKGDARIANDTGVLWVWSLESATGLLTDWVNAGDIVDIDWSVITNKPTSSVANIDDAVSKKHTRDTDNLILAQANAYAFQFPSTNYGLKFNATNLAYDFMNGDGTYKLRIGVDGLPIEINGKGAGGNNHASIRLFSGDKAQHEQSGIWLFGAEPGVVGKVRTCWALGIKGTLDTGHENFVAFQYLDEDNNWHKYLTIDPLGKVGIGVGTPVEFLDIVGNIKLTGNITDGTYASTPANIYDAVDKKHSQNKDTILDEGGANEVSASNLKLNNLIFHLQSSDVLTTGAKSWIRIPYNLTITGWELTADAAGSVEIDIWKDNLTNFPPTVDDTIITGSGATKPNLNTEQKNSSSDLTGWNVSLNEGDYIRFNIDSVDTVKEILLVLNCKRA